MPKLKKWFEGYKGVINRSKSKFSLINDRYIKKGKIRVKVTMTLDSATAVEFVNMVMGIIIFSMAIAAQKKINLTILKRGFTIIAISGLMMAAIAPYRAYYTYADLYELIPIGRALLALTRVILIVGLYLVGKGIISICGEEKIEYHRT
ncbi:MAG: hypothetical protein JJE19_06270 [Methanosarcinales archaeon]|nr:hypothetical protein [Methanosarcinales archaeon]HUV79935.1 hypothetical protein [Candidatus Bathyarchaeia archaeon]